MPHMEYKDRYKIISSLKNVKRVVRRETHDYVPNLKNLSRSLYYMVVIGRLVFRKN